DLLPADLCSELARLQDRTSGFPGALSRRTIEEDLGRPVDTVFSEFDDRPFAAASIGQLHRARLRATGQAVAVKVRRPHVAHAMESDLRFVRALCGVFDFLGILREAHLGDFIQELTSAMREELDYRLEATSLQRMRRSLRGHGVDVPE